MLTFRHPDKPIETITDVVVKLNPSEWIAQSKYDGWRCNIYFDENEIRCLTRKNNDLISIPGAKFDSKFLTYLKKLNVPPNSVLDSEYVGPRGNQKPRIYIFDCLAWNGEWLVDKPFEERWAICKSLTGLSENIELAYTVENDFLNLFNQLKNEWEKIRDLSLTEGIVLKNKNGKMNLSLKESVKNNRTLKLKFRDIRDQRW